MTVMANHRSVTLPAAELERFRQAAQDAGMSLASWLTAAGRERRRRQAADAYATYCAQPQIAEQITAYRQAVVPLQQAARRTAEAWNA
jgi:hypothetical protein